MVGPIFKKGRQEDISNSRCVSLTSDLGKIMGKLIQDSVNKELNDRNIN